MNNITDFLKHDRNVERTYTMLTVQEGSKYYQPTLGLNLSFFVLSELQFQNETVSSYVQQEAIKDGIVLTEVDVITDELTQVMRVMVQGQEIEAAF